MHAERQADRQTGGMASGGERKATGTMGEETTGSTLTEELCFMLFFGLNRGKRLFLMAGGRPSGTCTWNEEEGDWRHRENPQQRTNTRHDVILLYKRVQYGNTYIKPRELEKQNQKKITGYHLGFFLFLLYCSEEALLLLFFGWL